MRRIHVGAAQISPHFFDKEKTLEKTCQYVEKAAGLGIDLLVFPELYFCAYPYWRATAIALLPFRYPIAWDTEYLGGMQIHM
ncbi:MAG: hypothetical protein DRH12_13510 [Deltaproteobacteria bacterium]|nr:MAG: hypothetical protein DRH12_13510 [Deltaproteobacteria bacterium]